MLFKKRKNQRCAECGAELKKGNYCPECGAKVGSQDEPIDYRDIAVVYGPPSFFIKEDPQEEQPAEDEKRQ